MNNESYPGQFAAWKCGEQAIESWGLATVQQVVSAGVADFYILGMVNSSNWNNYE